MSDTVKLLLASTVVATILSTIISYIFNNRTEQRKYISESLTKLAMSSRQYRNMYIRMVEYDIDFGNQQKLAAKALMDEKKAVFDVHIQAADFSRTSAEFYQRELSKITENLTESAFILAGLKNRKFHKSKLQEPINELLSYKFVRIDDYGKAKTDIDKGLLPHCASIEAACNKLLWSINTAWWAKVISRFIK